MYHHFIRETRITVSEKYIKRDEYQKFMFCLSCVLIEYLSVHVYQGLRARTFYVQGEKQVNKFDRV